ncbi:MAG: DUF6932 family protein [Alphaproteobacteria bacterium]
MGTATPAMFSPPRWSFIPRAHAVEVSHGHFLPTQHICGVMVPKLVSQGVRKVLPEGEHEVTWDELRTRFGQGSRRQKILGKIREAGTMLRDAGAAVLYIDGSFATDKPVPDDWDGLFPTDNLDWTKVDPLLKDVRANRKAIADKYMADLFPANWREGKSGEPFLSFFQKDKKDRPKGLLVLTLGTLP